MDVLFGTPHLKWDKILIENVQCFAIQIATKSCTSQSSSFPYKLLSLNHSTSIINYFIPLNPTKCLVQPLAKTVSYFNSFFVSSTELWGFLPKETVLIDSIPFFKSNLKSYTRHRSYLYELLPCCACHVLLLYTVFLSKVRHTSFGYWTVNWIVTILR